MGKSTSDSINFFRKNCGDISIGICPRYGLPEHLYSYNGRQFTSEVFQNFMKENSVRHLFHTVPSSN